jgi:hypothetical protein
LKIGTSENINIMRKKKKPVMLMELARNNQESYKIYETNSVEHSKKMHEVNVTEYER